ncbi:MAG: ABC transporter substrate-binding protein [Sphaerochaetaceae bacterium]|nr:ABC transporter substrate-binding protein [Sphaerochaetaceae bacterium]
MRRAISIIMVVLLSATVLFAGGTEEKSPVSAEEKPVEQVYKEGWLSGGGITPTFITTATHRLDITVNEPLVAITWKGGLQPLIADSYEMQENGKTWILHIRDDAFWHDGTKVTSDDVIFSYNAYADPRVGSRWASKAASIKGYDEFRNGDADSLAGVTAIDDSTVKVELSQEMPLWMKIEQTYLVIFPNHILGDVEPEKLVSDEYWQHRIGTGPFKWAEYKQDQYIMLEKNEDYYLGEPKLDKLIYQMYSDASTHVSGLLSGQIDTTAYETTIISPKDAVNLENNQDLDIFVMEKGSPSFLTVNHEKEWADVRLRQALRYAIDVETMLDAIYPGAKPATTLLPQTWTHPDDLNDYAYNPEKAKELIKAAGWSGRTVDFVYHYQDEQSRNLIVAIQQYLDKVGIHIEPRKMDPAGLNALYLSGDFDMGLLGQGMGLDPAGGEIVVKSGEIRAHGYSNPEVDELFQEGKALAEQSERAPIYQKISKILNEELPQIYLWYDIRHLGFSKDVAGPYDHYKEQKIIYFNMPVYNEIETWYVK